MLRDLNVLLLSFCLIFNAWIQAKVAKNRPYRLYVRITVCCFFCVNFPNLSFIWISFLGLSVQYSLSWSYHPSSGPRTEEVFKVDWIRIEYPWVNVALRTCYENICLPGHWTKYSQFSTENCLVCFVFCDANSVLSVWILLNCCWNLKC